MATELEKWEEKLRNVFNEIDLILEEKYGGEFPHNPVRARRGTTSNPESDGLFDVGATYSAGFGSKFGEGYVIETRWATLKPVPPDLEKEAEGIVEKVLNDRLPYEFPCLGTPSVCPEFQKGLGIRATLHLIPIINQIACSTT